MSRTCQNQKEYEKSLILQFVECLKYSVSNPKWQDRPDALLTLSKGKVKKRVAIEHTDYFNDTVPGRCSPLTPIAEFWKSVQESLVRRISHRKHLTGISATVSLKQGLKLPRNNSMQPRQLAKELVSFTEARRVKRSEHLQFCRRDFKGYPMLESMVSHLILWRRTDRKVVASRWSWRCTDITTGMISLNLEYIKGAIRSKNRKALGYENWGRAVEKWLLIVASGNNISNNAGPAMQSVNWDDPELLGLCCNSPFDRIVFWERIRCWYKWLKPSKKVVQYRNPHIR